MIGISTCAPTNIAQSPNNHSMCTILSTVNYIKHDSMKWQRFAVKNDKDTLTLLFPSCLYLPGKYKNKNKFYKNRIKDVRGHCSCACVLRIKRDSARARDLCFSRSNSVTLVAKTISIRYISRTTTVTPIFYFSI